MRCALPHATLRAASSLSRAMQPGALCTDATFTRVLGSRGASEPILIDLLSAWRQAQTGDGTAAVRDVSISDRRVNEGQGMHARGALVVDVRAEGDGESYLGSSRRRPPRERRRRARPARACPAPRSPVGR